MWPVCELTPGILNKFYLKRVHLYIRGELNNFSFVRGPYWHVSYQMNFHLTSALIGTWQTVQIVIFHLYKLTGVILYSFSYDTCECSHPAECTENHLTREPIDTWYTAELFIGGILILTRFILYNFRADTFPYWHVTNYNTFNMTLVFS